MNILANIILVMVIIVLLPFVPLSLKLVFEMIEDVKFWKMIEKHDQEEESE